MEVRLTQFRKAISPISVTELGMEIEVKPVQPSNAILPILVTEKVAPWSSITLFGIVMAPPMRQPVTLTLLPSSFFLYAMPLTLKS